MLKAAGFVDVQVNVKKDSRELIKHWMPGSGAEDVVASAILKAVKPGATSTGEKAQVKAFWDGILQEDSEDEAVSTNKSGGIFQQIREDLAKSDHGHGPPSDHGHGAPSGHGHGGGHGHGPPSGHGHGPPAAGGCGPHDCDDGV
jgi:hypothetical protein